MQDKMAGLHFLHAPLSDSEMGDGARPLKITSAFVIFLVECLEVSHRLTLNSLRIFILT